MNKAKEYLEQIEWYDILVNSRLEERARLREMATKITPSMDISGVCGGGMHNKIENASVKLADLEREIDADTDTFVDLKREAEMLMKRVRNKDYMKILRKRYFEYKSFATIGGEMHICERAASKLNGRALQVYEKILEAHRNSSAGGTETGKNKKSVP